MAESKNTSSEEAPVKEQAAVSVPEENKVPGDGENLYFFPDIQKSVVAKSIKAATKMVQADLDAYEQQQKEGNN